MASTVPSAPLHRRSPLLRRRSLPQVSQLQHRLLHQGQATAPTLHREVPSVPQGQVPLPRLLGNPPMSRASSLTRPSLGPASCPLSSVLPTAKTPPSDAIIAWITQPTPSTLPRSAGVCAGMVPLGTTPTSLWLAWHLQWLHLLCSLTPPLSPLGLPLASPLPSLGTVTRTCPTTSRRGSPCSRLTLLGDRRTSCTPRSPRPTPPTLLLLLSLTLPWTLTLTLLILSQCRGEGWPCWCS